MIAPPPDNIGFLTDHSWVRPDTHTSDITVTRVLIVDGHYYLDNGDVIGPHGITYIDPTWDTADKCYKREVSFYWTPLHQTDALATVTVSAHLPSNAGVPFSGAVGDGWNVLSRSVKQVKPITHSVDSTLNTTRIGNNIGLSDFSYVFTTKLEQGNNFRIDLPIISPVSQLEVLTVSLSVLLITKGKFIGMDEIMLSECGWMWEAKVERGD